MAKGKNGVCDVCHKNKLVIRHHISYKPNKTIFVCFDCHANIHSRGKYPGLKPKKFLHHTIRISIENKDWLSLERMLRDRKTLDDTLTDIRKSYIAEWSSSMKKKHSGINDMTFFDKIKNECLSQI